MRKGVNMLSPCHRVTAISESPRPSARGTQPATRWDTPFFVGLGKANMFDVFDVYSGVGGFSAGAKAAGCTPIAGIDCDDTILRVYGGNTGGRCICARVFDDSVHWPAARSDLHVHFSPECQGLSKARRTVDMRRQQEGLAGIRGALDLILENGYDSWSIENVSTPETRSLLQSYADCAPARVAFTTVDCVDFGVPSTRLRLIAGPPGLIRLIKETPVQRVSVAEAFRRAGMDPPAPYIRNNSRSRNGGTHQRSVQGPCHTVTASHPLTWCNAEGVTVRCLTVAETAVIQGFPRGWLLPTGSRAGIRALGNAIPPPLAAAIMCAACRAKEVLVHGVPQGGVSVMHNSSKLLLHPAVLK